MHEHEKTPVTSRGSGTRSQALSIVPRLFQCTTPDASASISLYRGGVALNKPVTVKTARTGGGVRGEIDGWSAASRRRMREFLLTHQPIDGHEFRGLTLTIPGPPPTLAEAKRAFEDFTNHMLPELRIGLIWRIEIQRRGSFHWHGLASVPSGEGEDIKGLVCCLRPMWLSCLDRLGPVNHGAFVASPRSCLPGAYEHAVDFQLDGGAGAWLRYLQDHATKAKQEQTPDKCGKHWGVTGRKFFEGSSCRSFLRFPDDRAFFRFLRGFQRLATPQLAHAAARERSPDKHKARPFNGRSLGYRIRRGARGRSVWFSQGETIERLFRWAVDES